MSEVASSRSFFGVPVLSRKRVVLAFTVAVVTDGLQILLGPLGWVFADEVLDFLAMILTTSLLGFHPLLLPTFLVELFPVVGMFPSWTACTAAVVMLRRKKQPSAHDIEATVTAEPPPISHVPPKLPPS